MKKIGDMILYGGSYVHETASKEKKIVRFEPATKYLLLTVTNVIFDDGSKLEIPAAEAETRRYFLNQEPRFESERHTPFRSYLPGDTIVNARFDAGDLIVVNKMAYHFRKPERGEVFVFDTRGIEGIANKGSSTGQEGGTHYVKRLSGVPGDSLSIRDSQLIVNGKPATEWTIQRVASGKPPYQPCGLCGPSAPLSLLDGAGPTSRKGEPCTSPMIKNAPTCVSTWPWATIPPVKIPLTPGTGGPFTNTTS